MREGELELIKTESISVNTNYLNEKATNQAQITIEIEEMRDQDLFKAEEMKVDSEEKTSLKDNSKI